MFWRGFIIVKIHILFNILHIILNEMISIVCVLFSLILILKGGDLLVESSIWFAKKAGIPSLIVGATVVSFATTFPEISVAILSGIRGVEDLAINTALGSMVCNFALVLGLSFLLVPSFISKSGLSKKVLFFLSAILVLFVLSFDESLGITDAIIMLILFAVYMVSAMLDVRNKPESKNVDDVKLPSWQTIVIQFIVSAFAVGFGANILVSNIENISMLFGINEGLLGVFIISIGTNIPEFVTTMTAVRLKDSAIGIGNIFGASIIDATMLVAVTVLSAQKSFIELPKNLSLLTVLVLIIITGIIVLPIIKNEKSNRLQGSILVVLFVIYSIFLTKIS